MVVVCCWVTLRYKYVLQVGGVNKLVPNLKNKNKYVIHYRTFKLYLSLGMKMIGVPKILKLKESDWLEKYIDLNTGKRKNAVNSYGKDFFKLMNNSIYGKTLD